MKISKILTLLVIAFAIVACDGFPFPDSPDDPGQETPENPDNPEEPVEPLVEKLVKPVVALAETEEDEVGFEGVLEGKSFGLFFETDTDSPRYTAFNREVVYNKSSWSITGDSLFWKADATIEYMAYYPYSSSAITKDGSMNADFNISVPSVQTLKNVADSYFLYSPSREIITGENDDIDEDLEIVFENQMSSIVVGLTLADEFGSNYIINSVVLSGARLNRSFDLSKGEWGSVGSDAEDIALYGLKDSIYACIMVPQDLSAYNVIVNATIGSDSKVFTLTVNEALAIEPARVYNIALKVGRDNISLGGITVEAWDFVDQGVLISK